MIVIDEDRKAAEARLWLEIEQDYVDELRVRGYLVAVVEQAQRSERRMINASIALQRAKRHAARVARLYHRDARLAENQIKILAPLIAPGRTSWSEHMCEASPVRG